jgi:phage terminase large subunit-like protein
MRGAHCRSSLLPRRPKRPAYDPRIQRAIRYACDVASDKILAGKSVRLACQRFLDDLAAAESGRGRWAFDERFAIRPIHLAERLRNVKGPEAGKPIQLMDFQLWLIVNLFGFIERDTGIRRFRQASVWCPKGSGKSTLSAVLALATTFTEQEGGAEGYSAAVSRDQARIVFDLAKVMAQRDPEFRRRFGIEVKVNALHQGTTASRLMAISSDATALDGINVHFAVLDEIASHRSKAVYDVVITAMGKRRQPLLLSISTCTDNTLGIGKQVWDYTERVLEGQLEDDRFFGVLYAADQDDDPWDERTWQKANPAWGQMVQPEALRAVARQAQASPALKAAFLTRHLNLWVGADQALFDITHWDRCADPTLRIEQFLGQPCFAALDMATRVDLAAAALIFPHQDGDDGTIRYAVFNQAWLPAAAVTVDRNPAYAGWVEQGRISVTEGETTDFSAIEAWLREQSRLFDIRACAYDPYALLQLSQRMRNDGYPMTEYRATTLNFSEPTKLLDTLMRDGRLVHDGSPVARWCIGNVVGHYDARSNVYPRKARPESKIDCAIAMIMALGVSIASESDDDGVIYKDHDLLVF